MVVFRALLMKTRKYLPLRVGVGSVVEYLLSMLKALGSNVNMSNDGKDASNTNWGGHVILRLSRSFTCCDGMDVRVV